MMFDRLRGAWQELVEPRARSTEAVSLASPEILRLFGIDGGGESEAVTIESALGVPAVWAAVEVIAGSMASLPIHVYRKGTDGKRKPAEPDLQSVLNEVACPSEPLSAFDFMKWWLTQALTVGRGVAFIDRNAFGKVIGLRPLDPDYLTIKRKAGRKIYAYDDGGRLLSYDASDVLDLPFSLKGDALTHRSPIYANRRVIGLAQAVTNHGAGYFANGGIPPFAVTGQFQSGKAMERAGDDLQAATRKAAKEKRQALVLPAGLDIKALGADAQKSQMIETQRFCIEQVARIYGIQPILLQDLTHGTFSNTEQQGLQFVKHTLSRWVGQVEGELNLKIAKPMRGSIYIEFSLDGLLRGDFLARMQGYAQAVQNATLTPNEARSLENRPPLAGGDQLLIQGATVPLKDAGQKPQA